MSTTTSSAAAAAADNKDITNDKDDSTHSTVTQSFPPSHILADGRFIYLPPPNPYERSKFFERAIANYGLLESDMTITAAATKEETEEADEATTKKEETPKVHPLAAASARIQASGINELNRAINLSTLVNTGDYFGLSNIVDPSLELGGATTTTRTTSKDGQTTTEGTTTATTTTTAADGSTATTTTTAPTTTATGTTTTSGTATSTTATTPTNSKQQKEMQEEQRVKSAYILKRKRAVFDKASRVLQRHANRLQAAVVAQTIPDQRLRQLRPQWRLVAPEHGTRAKPHAVRPTEVVAIDVDVYDGGGGTSGQAASLVGRLANQAPRFATIELTDEYSDYHSQQQQHKSKQAKMEESKQVVDEQDKKPAAMKKEDDDDPMDIDHDSTKQEKEEKESSDDDHKYSQWTMAEPFAVVDPTLGKTSTDFDPNKVTYLTLQFDIEKASTGFCMSSCLEPMTVMTRKNTAKEPQQQSSSKKEDLSRSSDAKPAAAEKDKTGQNQNNDKSTDGSNDSPKDEKVLIALQHSLFCAKLFEAIRKEIMGGGDVSLEEHAQQQQQSASVVWLSSESEENFLPPPSVMVRPNTGTSVTELCVVYCHASEVKVQLDSEYTLRAKLVEAAENNTKEKELATLTTTDHNDTNYNNQSGSQSPQQLLLLCRSLLLHAQEAYHKHSLHESLVAAQKQREEEEKRLQLDARPKGLDRIQKKATRKEPKILQSVVGVGTKMLFEQRIRKVLVRVHHWLRSINPPNGDSLKTEWLALSLFDMHSHFCLTYGTALTIDVTIIRDELTVTRSDSGEYRKVKFHSDAEFEIYLKLELRRFLRNQQRQATLVGAGAAAAAAIVAQ